MGNWEIKLSFFFGHNIFYSLFFLIVWLPPDMLSYIPYPPPYLISRKKIWYESVEIKLPKEPDYQQSYTWKLILGSPTIPLEYSQNDKLSVILLKSGKFRKFKITVEIATAIQTSTTASMKRGLLISSLFGLHQLAAYWLYAWGVK